MICAKGKRSTLLGCTLLAMTLSVAARAATDSETVRPQIEARLHLVTEALTRGDDVEKVTKMLYADNALVAESGGEYRGAAAIRQALKDWEKSLGPGGVAACSYRIIDPVVATTQTFASFLNMTCKSNGVTTKEDFKDRLLYVWEKRAEGWRVVLESVYSGQF